MKEGRKYPTLIMIKKNGSKEKPRGVFAWPPKGEGITEQDFRNPNQWFPPPGEKPEKRFRLALYFRKGKASFETPFQIQMDDDVTVEVTKDKFQLRLWE